MIALPPIADKLALRSQAERRMKSLMLDGISGIQAGHYPRMIQDDGDTQALQPELSREIEDLFGSLQNR